HPGRQAGQPHGALRGRPHPVLAGVRLQHRHGPQRADRRDREGDRDHPARRLGGGMLARPLRSRLLLPGGAALPGAAPYDLITALSSVEVRNDVDAGDGFTLTFTASKTQGGEYGLVQSGLVDPMNRVALAVIIGTSPQPLMEGVITRHHLAPGSEPG